MMQTTLPFLALAVMLAGCTTPRPVIDQANHTAALAAQLEIEMKHFGQVQDAAAKARLRSIARQERDIEFAAGQARIAEAVRAANGDLATAKLQTKLIGVAAVIGEADRKSSDDAARIEAELAGLLKPLPGTAEKMTAAQKALAEMGTELSPSTRFAELKGFYKVVKEGVDANRKKIDDAEKAAKSAEKE